MIKKEYVEKNLKEVEEELKCNPSSVGLNFAKQKSIEVLEEIKNKEKLNKYFK